MINTQIKGYSGICDIGGKRYFFGKAEAADAEAIAELYRSVKIDCSNCESRLDPQNENSFEKKGGMFIVPNVREIGDELRDSDSFRAVFRDEEGHIAGSLWFSEKNEAYKGLPYYNMEDGVYPREIIVSPEYASRHIAKAMYYTVIKVMADAGFKRGAADMYRVLRYETGRRSSTVNMVNVPSMHCVCAIGAEFDGGLPIRIIKLDRLNVIIEPRMYLFEFDRILKTCERLFEKENIKITWGRGK